MIKKVSILSVLVVAVMSLASNGYCAGVKPPSCAGVKPPSV